MGYELAQLDQTQVFLNHMHSQQLESAAGSPLPGDSTGLEREIDDASRSAGLLAARMIRLMFRVLGQRSTVGTPEVQNKETGLQGTDHE